MTRLITAELVIAEHKRGAQTIAAPRGHVIVTPAAWSKAQDLGITIDQSGAGPVLAEADPGSAARSVDPSGVVVVRGDSVRLGRFTGAGPERDVRLTDVITGADRSPMTAGIMAWSRDDSFPWKLDYDEIDYVLEGVLRLTIDGRVVEGRAGDILYIPKGSSVIFGTPSHTRVFYVTYPANWAG